MQGGRVEKSIGKPHCAKFEAACKQNLVIIAEHDLG
jgi:hypothetical protein